MKLPDKLIRLLYNIWFENEPELWQFLIDNQLDNDYYLQHQPLIANTKPEKKLWLSKAQYDTYVERVSQRLKEIENNKEKEEAFLKKRRETPPNPIILELREAIASENWERVLAIRKMMQSAGGYDKELRESDIKTLVKNRR